MLRSYYSLIKPERTLANVITAGAGFFLAANEHIHWALLLYTLLGTSLVIASACIANNVIDRRLDALMQRTSKRPLASGEVGVRSALICAVLFGLIGFAVLAVHVNMLVFWLAIIAYIDYVGLYTYAKRHSVYSTSIGSVSGALSMVAGCCAVKGRVDLEAVLLFIFMVAWQMPHFYAIALFRLKDYKAAGMPVLPAVRGVKTTKRRIFFFTLVFTLAALSLSVFGYTGYTYTLAAVVLGFYWMYLGRKGLVSGIDSTAWARRMFSFSLIVLTGLSVIMAANAWLP